MTAAGLPFPIAALERVAAGLGAAQAVPLDAASLLRTSRRLERADDFGDPAFRGPLDLLLDSLERDAELHVFGRMHMRNVLVRALRTRLRLARLRAQRPELDAGPRRAPIVICGLPRTGTTLLHRLLSALPDLHGLPLWKLVEPIPPRGPDRRLAQARRRTRRMQWLSGRRLDAQHLMRAELPDECGHLFRPAFLSPDFAVAPALRYLRLYSEHDARPAYREYRALLALLAGDDERRLVLKDPFHALFHDALDEALPGAMVVQLHRDPREVVPSFVKLCTSAQRLVSHRRDLPVVARTIQDWLVTVAERSVARANEGRHAVLDLDYRRFVADPIQTVEDIHRHFGLPFDPSWRDPLQTLLASGRPKNPYSMDALGLDPDHLDGAFAPYVRRFLEP